MDWRVFYITCWHPMHGSKSRPISGEGTNLSSSSTPRCHRRFYTYKGYDHSRAHTKDDLRPPNRYIAGYRDSLSQTGMHVQKVVSTAEGNHGSKSSTERDFNPVDNGTFEVVAFTENTLEIIAWPED